ncbi:MAG: tRNA (adenosine(37)-N6)-threonylcarbamoyltransferase complex dimerization subunit type 1 TsaB [Candidatus Omnitrophica bacterium]|nr:tRNA (adenosine(37)-N6)-threonylcarbamoyltransferase complex dimerization subunit type 1 TsaB [Candidatus Omnitrophota bacterium]
MYILSLETSTKIFSLAVSKDNEILRFRNVHTARILESSIIGAIDHLLASCDLNLDNIDTLAVGLGPGSFTSLRVGLSTVKAFALATGKKLVGINSLDILASRVVDQKADEICTIIDARRGKVYAAIYGSTRSAKGRLRSPFCDKTLTRKTDYLLTTVDDVLGRVHGATLFVGDGLGLYKDHLQKAYRAYAKKKSTGCRPIFALEKFWYPQAKELAKLAFKRLETEKYDDPANIVPVYLYPQDCQVNPT